MPREARVQLGAGRGREAGRENRAHLFISFERQRDRQELLTYWFTPRCPQQQGLGQAEAAPRPGTKPLSQGRCLPGCTWEEAGLQSGAGA